MRHEIILGDSGDVLKNLAPDSVDALVTDPPAGIGFMSKDWDSDKGGSDVWIEWLATIMREAFRGMKPGAHGLVWAIPRTAHWTTTALERSGFEIRDVIVHLFGTGFPKSLDVAKEIDKRAGHWRGRAGQAVSANGSMSGPNLERSDKGDPVTELSKLWSGWGTALKPAAEHWILVRKPCAGTVAKNVMQHGTGGINIDASRVGDELVGWNGGSSGRDGGEWRTHSGFEAGEPRPVIGRWPTSVILSDDAPAMLDAQAGSNVSRFFYQPKASREDREAGCETLPLKSYGEVTGREEGSDGLNSPRSGAGRTSDLRNHHPTVKSTALMRYLVRLITPPGGIVLDPFAGSGSTGVACMYEGMNFVGIERDAEYAEIARARIRHANGETPITIVTEPTPIIATTIEPESEYGEI